MLPGSGPLGLLTLWLSVETPDDMYTLSESCNDECYLKQMTDLTKLQIFSPVMDPEEGRNEGQKVERKEGNSNMTMQMSQEHG